MHSSDHVEPLFPSVQELLGVYKRETWLLVPASVVPIIIWYVMATCDLTGSVPGAGMSLLPLEPAPLNRIEWDSLGKCFQLPAPQRLGWNHQDRSCEFRKWSHMCVYGHMLAHTHTTRNECLSQYHIIIFGYILLQGHVRFSPTKTWSENGGLLGIAFWKVP